MKIFLRTLVAMAVVHSSLAEAMEHCPPAGNADKHPVFNASVLREGRFIYHTTLKGESLGETVIEIRRIGAAYRITMSAPEIAQSWQATVRRSFAPLAARLTMQVRGVPYAMNLYYEGVTISGEERKGEVTTPVSATAEGIVIDQRVDWASMMAVAAPAGSSVTMSVFDPSTGFSPLLGKVGATETMNGAQGATTVVRLDYSICKREHVENYTVFATEATPRYMLREDMPNELVSRLVRMEP